MSKITDVIEKLVLVTANFSSLKDQVLRIELRLNDHTERISRLESSKEAIVEQARSAAVTGVARLETHLIERIVKIEEFQKRSLPPAQQIPEKTD
jgi:predicted  nucleic acid-binding Zn-ribbon protein